MGTTQGNNVFEMPNSGGGTKPGSLRPVIASSEVEHEFPFFLLPLERKKMLIFIYTKIL